MIDMLHALSALATRVPWIEIETKLVGISVTATPRNADLVTWSTINVRAC